MAIRIKARGGEGVEQMMRHYVPEVTRVEQTI